MYTKDELFDILNEDGSHTGKTAPRGTVHREGLLHGSVHIWVARVRLTGLELLLQKRADDKDSYPSCFDAAATGHIDSGEDHLSAAIREVGEELGLTVHPADLVLLSRRRVKEDNIFHGERFINNEYTWIYLLRTEVNDNDLKFEEAEISALEWRSAEEIKKAVSAHDTAYCIDHDELTEVIRCCEDIL